MKEGAINKHWDKAGPLEQLGQCLGFLCHIVEVLGTEAALTTTRLLSAHTLGARVYASRSWIPDLYWVPSCWRYQGTPTYCRHSGSKPESRFLPHAFQIKIIKIFSENNKYKPELSQGQSGYMVTLLKSCAKNLDCTLGMRWTTFSEFEHRIHTMYSLFRELILAGWWQTSRERE